MQGERHVLGRCRELELQGHRFDQLPDGDDGVLQSQGLQLDLVVIEQVVEDPDGRFRVNHHLLGQPEPLGGVRLVDPMVSADRPVPELESQGCPHLFLEEGQTHAHRVEGRPDLVGNEPHEFALGVEELPLGVEFLADVEIVQHERDGGQNDAQEGSERRVERILRPVDGEELLRGVELQRVGGGKVAVVARGVREEDVPAVVVVPGVVPVALEVRYGNSVFDVVCVGLGLGFKDAVDPRYLRREYVLEGLVPNDRGSHDAGHHRRVEPRVDRLHYDRSRSGLDLLAR
mmetsp:Transcript_1146/g.2711  ORF Transcript_1146/g.2711 Transcript_1146/m.2711 type:complete len:288 (-) Transcript_1146:1025-1888(-)